MYRTIRKPVPLSFYEIYNGESRDKDYGRNIIGISIVLSVLWNPTPTKAVFIVSDWRKFEFILIRFYLNFVNMFNYTSNYNMHRKRKFSMKIKKLSAIFRVFIELPSYITVTHATKTAVQSDQ